MKRHLSTSRAYRENMRPGEGELSYQVVLEETDLLIIASVDVRTQAAEVVRTLRGQIKNHILLNPDFLHSLEPVDVSESAPEVVRRMARAGRLCGVGPMAAVAGTIAQMVGERFVAECPDMMVENGGDVFVRSTRERVVALLSEPDSGAGVGLRIPAEKTPLGICSSSATIGHSLSFGKGELVTVLSADTSFADAAATALCNMMRTPNDLGPMLERAESWAGQGLKGVFAQCGKKMAAWGDLELVSL